MFSSFGGITAIHRKVSEELKKQNKQNRSLPKKAYNLRFGWEVEYRQTLEATQSSCARKLPPLESCRSSCLLEGLDPFSSSFHLQNLGLPSFSNKSVKASSHISFGKVRATGRSLFHMQFIPREGKENATYREWSSFEEKKSCQHLATGSGAHWVRLTLLALTDMPESSLFTTGDIL